MPKTTIISAGVSSLEKGLALFERILGDHGQTPVTELTTDLELPRSTLHRLLGTLERQGLVARVGRGRFDIGLTLVDAASRVSVPARLAQISRPPLRRLGLDCRASAHLGVLDNDMVTYLVKVTPRSAKASASFAQENGQLEAYCSGIGKILLAHLPDAQRQAYLANGPFVALTDRTMTDPQTLATSLVKVRADRFARDDGEIADELHCLAVPVNGPGGTVIAAISMSFARSERPWEREDFYRGKLHDCAAAIESRLIGKASRSPPSH